MLQHACEAHFEHPKPYDNSQGWQKNDDGILEPVWSSGPILPEALVDLVETSVREEECVDDVEDMDIDFDELVADGDDEEL